MEAVSNVIKLCRTEAVIVVQAHATSNASVAGITWTELPGYGRTLSGITPLPRMGDNGTNFTAGTGPSVYGDITFLY